MARKREIAARVKSAISALCKQQHEALERATFVGMDLQEKTEYDDRAQRIRRLQHALNTQLAAETPT
jgi:hypothetical protein